MFTIEIGITLFILLGAIALFVTEKVAIDVTAMIVIGSLVLSGILTPQEGLSGFSNTAVATVGAMFVLSAGIERSGALSPMTAFLEKLFRANFWLGIVSMLVLVSTLSAFINNTPVVALFIPVVLSCARSTQISPEKLLIPLSFASMFGGICTLVGTSTNILASDYSASAGLGAFGMFEMTRLGLIFLAAGFVYLLFVGLRLLPGNHQVATLEEKYQLGGYLTVVVLQEGAPSVGKTLKNSPLVKDLGLEVIEIQRGEERYFNPPLDWVFEVGDALKVKGDVDTIRKLQMRNRVLVQPLSNKTVSAGPTGGLVMHEVVVLPNSELSGVRLADVDFEALFGEVVFLGVRGRRGLQNRVIGDWRLTAGDCLLFASSKDRSEALHRDHPDLFIVDHAEKGGFSFKNGLISSLTVAAVITVGSLEIMPIVTAALLGCLVLILTKVVSAEEAYKSVSWKVVMLLAGSISLGAALEKTGAARLLAEQIYNLGGSFGPVVMLSIVYLITTLMTETMSNNATVVLLAPIVIALAQSMGVSPKPFLMAITFAASASFMTPIGYQTNTMVYAAGSYTFKDFFRVGAPLNLLFWILASILIPIFFPFK
jgi:di/tricarboxylate transporter